MASLRSRSSQRRIPLCLEELESRQLLAVFQPTPMEQLFLERLNDARANPAAYGASIGLDLSGVAPSQPLAFNPQLTQAARAHSQDMNDRAYFAHNTPDGIDPGMRLTQAGFAWLGYGESIAAGTGYPTPESALSGLIIDTGVPDLGHRRQLLAIDATFQNHTQVGVGVVQNGTGPYTNYYTIDSGYTGDNRPFLTGVVFDDANASGKYDLGEGLGGITITVAGVGSVTNLNTGGYSFQLNPGTYTVTASGGSLGAPVTRMVTVDSQNVRLNFTPGGSPDTISLQEANYIGKLYTSDLGRVASSAEVEIWRPTLESAGAAAVANAIERSTEARTRLVRSWYVNYLGRSAGNGEEQGWVSALQTGATEEQVLSGIIGSDEYAKRANALQDSANGDVNLVQELFQQFLNRSAGAAEVDNFVHNILPAVGHAGAVQIVLTSAEYRGDTVRSDYTQILQRPTTPSPSEINSWVFSGLDQTSIRVGFEGSTEYYQHS